jgi:hypothetical protein
MIVSCPSTRRLKTSHGKSKFIQQWQNKFLRSTQYRFRLRSPRPKDLVRIYFLLPRLPGHDRLSDCAPMILSQCELSLIIGGESGLDDFSTLQPNRVVSWMPNPGIIESMLHRPQLHRILNAPATGGCVPLILLSHLSWGNKQGKGFRIALRLR